MLAKARGLDWSRLLKLGDLQKELQVSLEEMLELVEEVLHPEPYSRDEICKTLGISAEQLCADILSANTQHGERAVRPQEIKINTFLLLYNTTHFTMLNYIANNEILAQGRL